MTAAPARPCTGTTATGTACENTTTHPTRWCGQCARPPAALAAYAPTDAAAVAAAGPGPDPLSGGGAGGAPESSPVTDLADLDKAIATENWERDPETAARVIADGAARGAWPQVTIHGFKWVETYGSGDTEGLWATIGDPDNGGVDVEIYRNDGISVFDATARSDLDVYGLAERYGCDGDDVSLVLEYAFTAWEASMNDQRYDLYNQAAAGLSAATNTRANGTAADPATDPEVLENLVNYGSPEARRAALANPALPGHVRSRIALEAD